MDADCPRAGDLSRLRAARLGSRQTNARPPQVLATTPKLTEESVLSRALAALRRRAGLALASICLVVAPALWYLHAQSPIYRSSATLTLEQRANEPLRHAELRDYASDRLNAINTRLLTDSRLLQSLAPRPDDVRGDVDELRTSVEVLPLSAEVTPKSNGDTTTIGFSVTYTASSAQGAQDGAAAVAAIYLQENDRQSELLRQTEAQLRAQVDQARHHARLSARALGAFKAGQSLPEAVSSEHIQRLLAPAYAELSDLDNQIEVSLLEGKRLRSHAVPDLPASASRPSSIEEEYVTLALKNLSGNAIALGGGLDTLNLAPNDTGTNKTSVLQSLQANREELDRAEQQYSASHVEPQLTGVARALDTELSRAHLPGWRVAVDRKDSVAGALRDNAVLLAHLQHQRAKTADSIEDLRTRLHDAERTQQKLATLSTEHKHAVALLAQAEDQQLQFQSTVLTQQPSQRFSLTDPASLAQVANSPQRLAIVLFAALVAIACALGAITVAETLDGSVRGSRGVAAIVGQRPIGVIPRIEQPRARRTSAPVLLTGLAIGASGLVLISLVNELVMPLGEIWHLLFGSVSS